MFFLRVLLLIDLPLLRFYETILKRKQARTLVFPLSFILNISIPSQILTIVFAVLFGVTSQLFDTIACI